MLGYFWWPLFDQIDWDGALTHSVGKIHEVGMYSLSRQRDGTLAREVTPLIAQFSQSAAAGNKHVGELGSIVVPMGRDADERPLRKQDSGNGDVHFPAAVGWTGRVAQPDRRMRQPKPFPPTGDQI